MSATADERMVQRVWLAASAVVLKVFWPCSVGVGLPAEGRRGRG
jgi:hypothetical protein